MTDTWYLQPSVHHGDFRATLAESLASTFRPTLCEEQRIPWIMRNWRSAKICHNILMEEQKYKLQQNFGVKDKGTPKSWKVLPFSIEFPSHQSWDLTPARVIYHQKVLKALCSEMLLCQNYLTWSPLSKCCLTLRSNMSGNKPTWYKINALLNQLQLTMR